MTTLDAIRARHAAADGLHDGVWALDASQAHADRGALLDALDRLAGITTDEVADVLAQANPADWHVTRVERDAAAAVLALIRERVGGRPGLQTALVRAQAPQEGPSGGRGTGVGQGGGR